MTKNNMDKSGAIIIKICIFSIVLSLTALALCALFNYFDKPEKQAWNPKEKTVIVIDAGHGGQDGGASSADGLKEKDLNLSVALSVGQMLESCGFEVIQTRNEDMMLSSDDYKGSKKMQDLKTRLDVINSAENAIFVSIHMNKFSQKKYSGLQVFYSKNKKESEDLARIIQKNTKDFLQQTNEREIKSAGSNIFLLDNIKTPAVLVECGFLSNPNECELLKTDEYKKELAAVISSSIIEFLQQP